MQKKKILTVKDSLERKLAFKTVTKRSVHDKRKGTRPDGTDIERYKGNRAWSDQRWGWEFLRRNNDFQDECRKLRANDPDISEASIAEKFGLYSYKDYRDSYNSYPKPRFRTVSLRIIGQTDLGYKQSQLIPKIRLKAGQVAIVFDLAFAIKSGGSIQRQIETAQSKLMRLAQLYHRVDKLPNSSRKQKNKFIDYLRVLDLFWSKERENTSPEAIHNYLRNKPSQRGHIEYNQKFIYDNLKAAHEHTLDYLYIAASKKQNLQNKQDSAEDIT